MDESRKDAQGHRGGRRADFPGDQGRSPRAGRERGFGKSGETGNRERRGTRDGIRSERSRGFPKNSVPSMAKVEGTILETLPAIEKALTRLDFSAAQEGFHAIALAVKPLKLSGIDDIRDFDARTHLFTSLIRAGRIPTPKTTGNQEEDGRQEARWKSLLETVGRTWMALGNGDKAMVVLESAGHPEDAILALEKSGEWEDAAQKALANGLSLQAARILAAHGQDKRALEIFAKIPEAAEEAFRLAVTSKDDGAARKFASGTSRKTRRAMLLQCGRADLLMEISAALGDWGTVADLYIRAGQHQDAARACEAMGDFRRAIQLFRQGGRKDEALRLVKEESYRRLNKGDLVGAGELLRKYGLVAEAVEMVRTSHPETAFLWLEKSGQRDRARAFAAETAGRMDEKGDREATALWLERSGQKDRAAAIWLELGRKEDALSDLEAAHMWNQALALAMELGNPDRVRSICARGRLPLPDADFMKASGTKGKKSRRSRGGKSAGSKDAHGSAAPDCGGVSSCQVSGKDRSQEQERRQNRGQRGIQPQNPETGADGISSETSSSGDGFPNTCQPSRRHRRSRRRGGQSGDTDSQCNQLQADSVAAKANGADGQESQSRGRAEGNGVSLPKKPSGRKPSDENESAKSEGGRSAPIDGSGSNSIASSPKLAQTASSADARSSSSPSGSAEDGSEAGAVLSGARNSSGEGEVAGS